MLLRELSSLPPTLTSFLAVTVKVRRHWSSFFFTCDHLIVWKNLNSLLWKLPPEATEEIKQIKSFVVYQINLWKATQSLYPVTPCSHLTPKSSLLFTSIVSKINTFVLLWPALEWTGILFIILSNLSLFFPWCPLRTWAVLHEKKMI